MKLQVLLFGLDRTGGALVIRRYAKAAEAAGHDISVRTLGRRRQRRFMAPEPTWDVTYLGYRARAYRAAVRYGPLRPIFPSLEMRALQRSVTPADLTVATYSLTLEPARHGSAPVLYHVQHYEPLIVEGRRARRTAERSYRLSDYTTANCTWAADRVAEAGGDVKGIICPGIDLTSFQPAPAPLAAAPLAAGAPVRVLTLGKRAAWKGMVDVVHAADELAQDRPVTLVTYGPDAPRPGPKRAVLEHHGLVDQVKLSELYRTSHVAVSASWYESFPLPPLEAMATATPVVCTRLGTEDYAEHEVNSLVVPPKRPDELTSALRRLLRDDQLRAQLAEAGPPVAARFTWEAAEGAFLDHAARAAGRSVPPETEQG